MFWLHPAWNRLQAKFFSIGCGRLFLTDCAGIREDCSYHEWQVPGRRNRSSSHHTTHTKQNRYAAPSLSVHTPHHIIKKSIGSGHLSHFFAEPEIAAVLQVLCWKNVLALQNCSTSADSGHRCKGRARFWHSLRSSARVQDYTIDVERIGLLRYIMARNPAKQSGNECSS